MTHEKKNGNFFIQNPLKNGRFFYDKCITLYKTLAPLHGDFACLVPIVPTNNKKIRFRYFFSPLVRDTTTSFQQRKCIHVCFFFFNIIYYNNLIGMFLLFAECIIIIITQQMLSRIILHSARALLYEFFEDVIFKFMDMEVYLGITIIL